MNVVTLKAVVDRALFDKFERDVKTLSNSKIQISIVGFSDAAKQAEKLIKAVDNTTQAIERQSQASQKLSIQQQNADSRALKAQADLLNAQTKRVVATQNQAKIEAQQADSQTRRMREERLEAQELQKSMDEVKKSAIETGSVIDDAFTAIWRTYLNFVRQYVQKALDEMQAVDDALVEVRKVTDFSDAELDTLEQAAYDTATAYGALASN